MNNLDYDDKSRLYLPLASIVIIIVVFISVMQVRKKEKEEYLERVLPKVQPTKLESNQLYHEDVLLDNQFQCTVYFYVEDKKVTVDTVEC